MNTIVQQITIMGLIMLMGYLLRKRGYFNDVVTKDLSKFLLRTIIPLTIIESFMTPFDGQLFKDMLVMAFFTIIITFLFIFMCNILYTEDMVTEKYATIFTNKGFIGIPIITAIFSKEAIVLLTPMITVGHLFMWTYGINLFATEKKKVTLKQLFINPSFIAMTIGLILFVLPFEYPYVITKSISLLTSLNTPLAMIIIGVYLANDSIVEILKNKSIYYVSLIRLLILPLFVILLMKWMPIDRLMKEIIIIAMAVPAATNTAMFAQLTGSDPTRGAQIVSQTTILSALSLPFIMWIMEIFL